MSRVVRGAGVLTCVLASLGVTIAFSKSRAPEAGTARARSIWAESFEGPGLDWAVPNRKREGYVGDVYSVSTEGSNSYLKARHDRTGLDSASLRKRRIPSVHYGKSFQDSAIPIRSVHSLQWKWRVVRHPSVGQDKWLDVAASVYVLIQQPSLLIEGVGFKFGWLNGNGEAGGRQMGIVQIQLRESPAQTGWSTESLDLYRTCQQSYGWRCASDTIVYVGVMTDADGTDSMAEAHYDDFLLLVEP